MTINISKQLTRFAPGSMRELWTISYPLIISNFSTQLMLLSDRIILAQWSSEAMSAAAVAGSVFAAIQIGLVCIAGISEVFVAQYNGGNKPHLIGKATWQMIWFSLMSGVVFIPLTILFKDHSVPEMFRSDGVPYFFWVMMGIVFYPLASTLSSFYVGRGKTKMITLISIGANIINVLVDIILVFGVDGLIDPMGTTGAAIGTTIAEASFAFALFIPFLNSKNNKLFHTRSLSFDRFLFWKSLKIGAPFGVAVSIEILAWAAIFRILALASYQHVLVMTVGVNALLFFIFFINGLSRGITAVVANFIGSEKIHYITKTVRSGAYLFLIFSSIVALMCLIFPDVFLALNLPDASPEDLLVLKPAIFAALTWVFLYVFLDGIAWAIGAALIAGGDSWFIFLATACLIWFTAIIPIYITTLYFDAGLVSAWRITCIHISIVLSLFLWRYMSNKWLKLKV